MAVIAPLPRQRFFDANGLPLAGGQLFTYLAGTTTPQATYTDSTGLTPNSNPVVLDADGYADVWLGSAKYKFVLEDDLGNVLWTVDNIDGTAQGGNATPGWSTYIVVDGQSASGLPGQSVDISKFSGCLFTAAITRGTTVYSTGFLSIQNVNGTPRIALGEMMANEAHGITFTLTNVGNIYTLNAALSSGPGSGVIRLSQEFIPL